MLRLLGMVRPQRILNKLDIDKLGTFPTRRAVRVTSKEYMGERDLITIKTDCATCIAEGFGIHA